MGGSDLGEATWWGPFELFEPLDGAGCRRWVARRAGAIDLVVVEELPAGARWPHPGVRRLTHPQLVGLLDRTSHDGRQLQVTELVLGITLAEVLRHLAERGRPLPTEVALAWADQMAEGLSFLEQAEDDQRNRLGLRHGRLEPSTVRVDAAGNLKLDDYGLLQSPRGSRASPALLDADTLLGQPDGPAWARLVGRLLDAGAHDGALGWVNEARAWLDRGTVAPARSWADWAAEWKQVKARLPAAGTPADRVDWLRTEVPALEQAAMARLERVRGHTERRQPTAAEPSLSATPTVPQALVPPEPPEPSVMTMPGAVLAPGAMARTAPKRGPSRTERPATRVPRKRRSRRQARQRRLVAAGVSVVAVLLAGVAASRVVGWRRPAQATRPARAAVEPRVEAKPASELPLAPLGGKGGNGSAPAATVAAPGVQARPEQRPNRTRRRSVRTTPSKRRARVGGGAVLEAEVEDAVDPSMGLARGEASGASVQTGRVTGRSGDPAAASSAASAASAGPPARADTAPARSGAVDARVREALEDPGNEVAFEEALRALRRSAKALPDPRQPPVEAAIQRAEFSWRAQDLRRAHERLRAAR